MFKERTEVLPEKRTFDTDRFLGPYRILGPQLREVQDFRMIG
jgi:hypothetical protein